jgi:G3E family GTPase
MNRIPVNLVTGALGAGKTSLIRQLLQQKPANETWALLVNEFGAIGIDGAIMSETNAVLITQLPGGCICCSAQNELKQALTDIAAQQPHRLIIEPTGLGEPDTLADLFIKTELKKQFELHTLVSVFDSAHTDTNEFEQFRSLQNLLHMADVIVLNKTDLASADQLLHLQHYLSQLYPPKQHIISTRQGRLEVQLLMQPHQTPLTIHRPTANNTFSLAAHSATHTHTSIETTAPYAGLVLNNLIERRYYSDLGVQSIGWLFSAQQRFNWQAVQQLFADLNHCSEFKGIKRAKGLFRTADSWMLFQWANKQVSRELIAYRKDSRLELLIEKQAEFDFLEFERQLTNCLTV